MAKLVEKKLMLKTKKFFNKFVTISKYEVVEDIDNCFLWHNSIVNDFIKIEREKVAPSFSINNAIDFDTLWERVIPFLKKDKGSKSIFFINRNRRLVKIEVESFEDFIREYFSCQNTYDIFIMFLCPNRVFAFCDNEYDIDFLYITE